MKQHLRLIELSILTLILYSIITHFIELEFFDSDVPTGFFLWSERVVTVLFTIEYLVRWTVSRKLSYPLRPMAIIDFLAILPFYLGFLVDLRSLRLLRMMRVLRLFKLSRYTNALQSIRNAFFKVRYEFGILGFAVFIFVWISAIAVFELEMDAQPQVFGKLSDALWFALTTITTVGYGDKVPITAGGRCVAVFLMIGGLGMFGTFVSLVGSAFLEEIRNSILHQTSGPAISDFLIDAGSASKPSECFDPGSVLRAIEAGVFNDGQASRQAEAVQLLTVACRILSSSGRS